MAKAKKIFVGNYKGGVGKTTSIYQIACHMVLQEKKVLLVDLDPQCSLSEICLSRIDWDLYRLNPGECLNYIFDAWIQKKMHLNLEFPVDKELLVKQTGEGIDFIPSNIFYEGGGLDELSILLKDDFDDLFVLQQFFQKTGLDQDYDFVLFDCPPSNNLITQGAFLLSDYYLIPSIIQTVSIRGVAHYITTVDKIYLNICQEHRHSSLARLLFGERPQLLGIFETLKKGTVKNQQVLLDLKEYLDAAEVQCKLPEGTYFFHTVIHNYEEIARATAAGNRREEYASLAAEILNCLEGQG
ncbi:ParA family protein [Neobacillus terrae]|uniref:ParA family protein n=1 Tax=Neobacillus terrae TaxID=3034837 RepID=UPI00140B3423|nr:AAA family ATPase [Neobacillus terrae]NHM32830.1 AAA family ATPase [Neobacillus terrae]